MHRAGDTTRGANHSPPHPLLKLRQQRVHKEAAGWKDRKATGLVNDQQIAIVEDDRALAEHRYSRFLPWGPEPNQPIACCKRRIGMELLAVAPDLTGGEPLDPHRPVGMAISACIETRNAWGRVIDTVAIGMAPIEGGRQPDLTLSRRATQPGRSRGRSAPVRCDWRCQFW